MQLIESFKRLVENIHTSYEEDRQISRAINEQGLQNYIERNYLKNDRKVEVSQ